jgi:amidase
MTLPFRAATMGIGMGRAGFFATLLFVCACVSPASPQSPADWSGKWDVTATFANGMSASQMTLIQSSDAIEGSSGPLDENRYFPLNLRGALKRGVAELDATRGTTPVGRLKLRLKNQALSGEGTLYGVPVVIAAVRPGLAPQPPTTHDFKPASFVLQYSSRNAPVLRIRPGDTVKTFTLDNEGRDASLQYRGMPGNTLTGPIWVEGAMPGDTLVVRINKVTLNRDTASMYSGALDSRALLGGYTQAPTSGWSRVWTLDREKGVARPEKPGDKLKALELPLRPMIGSIGVAPPLNQAIMAGDVGFHGGNMDYQRVTTGATIYFPVWQVGAFLTLGDGHALQGDGEISGQGLETSLDVEFTVDLIKGETLGQVWLEDADSVMVTGIDNGLDMSLQRATTGLSQWLKKKYSLSDSEIATLLSSSIEYDIAEIVDPRPHVVARIAKSTLAMLKP